MLIPLRDPGDHSLRGVLFRQRGRWLVLVDCALVRPDKSETVMLGEVVIHRDNVVLIGSDAR